MNTNDDIIHKDKDSAKIACEQYVTAMLDLQSKLGVWEENDDSCSATRVYTQYRDEIGKITNYCHD